MENKSNIREQCMFDTLNAISDLVGYKPNHDKEFSGDKLVEIVAKHIELLYKLASHILNPNQLPPLTLSVRGADLLKEVHELNTKIK